MTDLECQMRLNDLRVRVCNGEAISPEEMRLILDDLHRNREALAAATAKSKRTAAAKKQPDTIDLDALFTSEAIR